MAEVARLAGCPPRPSRTPSTAPARCADHNSPPGARRDGSGRLRAERRGPLAGDGTHPHARPRTVRDFNPYRRAPARAVARPESAAAGYTLLLADPHDDPGYEATAVARPRSRVDGCSVRRLGAQPWRRHGAAGATWCSSTACSVARTTRSAPRTSRSPGWSRTRGGRALPDRVRRRARGPATTVERLGGLLNRVAPRRLEYARVIGNTRRSNRLARAVKRPARRAGPACCADHRNNAMTIGAVQPRTTPA
ncbi:hypothetical protein HBB16_12375 [Pseudonocardia sp. MCCB 268]|nr:hypothetical protein [Pseudonocardia cytotoxica]